MEDAEVFAAVWTGPLAVEAILHGVEQWVAFPIETDIERCAALDPQTREAAGAALLPDGRAVGDAVAIATADAADLPSRAHERSGAARTLAHRVPGPRRWVADVPIFGVRDHAEPLVPVACVDRECCPHAGGPGASRRFRRRGPRQRVG